MKLTYIGRTILSSFLLLLFLTHLRAQDDFFSGNFKATDQIPTPQQYFGFEPGSQPVHHLQVVGYFKKLAGL